MLIRRSPTFLPKCHFWATEKDVDVTLARELLGKAKEIIDWLESLLPADIHREKLKTPYHLSFNVNASGDDEKEMYLVGVKSSHSLNLYLLPSNE